MTATETFVYDDTRSHVAIRVGPRAQLSLVALQRIYLAGNIDYYPLISLGTAYRDTGTEVAEEWNWNIAAGFRFLY